MNVQVEAQHNLEVSLTCNLICNLIIVTSQLEFPCKELPGGPYDVILATLAFHSLAGHQAQEEETLKRKYTEIFLMVKNSLKPGGLLLFGDHVGSWGLYKQIRTLEEVRTQPQY